jgi:glycerate dehydrogenase
MSSLVFLDAETVGRDIDLSGLKQFGQVEIYSVTYPNEVIARVSSAEIVITNKVVIDKVVMDAAPNLKLICVAATGTNNIDIDYAKQKGIAVTNVPGYSTQSVVEMTFAMLFYLLRHLSYYDNYVKSGRYAQSSIFTHLDRPFWELVGKRWGIIGLGNIGRNVARIAKCFGCEVVYYSTSGRNINPEFKRVNLSELLETSDIVSIHAPLNKRTRNLITYNELKCMQRHAILLNLGRGGIVNEIDLARALEEGLIAAAGLDVLEQEPIHPDNPLLKLKDKILITPHIAWSSIEARKRLIDEVVLNIKAFLNGEWRNRII